MLSALLSHSTDIFFLILGEDEVFAPSTLSSTLANPFPAGRPMDRLRDAVSVSSVVPLHVLLKVQLELTVGIRGARDPGQRIFSALRTELSIEVFGRGKASVASLDESLQMADPL